MTAASAFLHQQAPDGQRNESRPQEPSMEDILASIRRIIADDQVQGQRTPYGGQRRLSPADPVGPSVAVPEPAPAIGEVRGQDDVLDLARMRGSVSPERGPARDLQARSVPAPEPRPAPPPPEPFAPEPQAAEPYDDGIDVQSFGDQDVYEAPASRSATTLEARLEASQPESRRRDGEARALGAAAVGDALISSKPGASVMSAFETLAATVILQNDDMLERIMRDQLRPLIKTWLDDNLPTMVERLVRAEIERVARGGRG